MNRILPVLVLLLALPAVAPAAPRQPTPRERLDAYLAEPDETGNVFAQSRQFDQVDYRTMLRHAATDRAGLLALLRYNGRATLMGEGAEAHADILVLLLDTWGDEVVARTLQACSPKAVAMTQHFLEYGGATPARFPRTFAVPGEQ